MTEPADAFEFLEELRKKNGRAIQNYKDVYRYLSLKAREKRIPLSNQFELTPFCNFSCKMCYVHLNAEQMNGKKLLPVSTWKGLMYQAWQAGMLLATLTGGECLAYPGFDELFLYLHSLGCEVSILTNGFFLDDKRIQFFREHKPCRIQVTLYGWNDEVYERVTGQRAFSTVAENIQKAREAGLPVFVNITPNPYLGEDVFETIRTAYRLSPEVTINSALFQPREETGRLLKDFENEADLYIRIYRLVDELNGRETKEIDMSKLPPPGGPNHECNESGLLCGGGRSGFAINWQGRMMPCNRLEMLWADPLTEGFSKAWNKVNRQACSWLRTAECDGCVYFRVCNNCAGNMLRYAEPGKQPTALCEQTRQFVCHGLRHIPECDDA